MERSLAYLDPQTDPQADVLAHLLMAAGRMGDGQSLEEAGEHLRKALRIAADDGLADMSARIYFILGTMHAERGDLTDAIRAYEEAIRQSEVAGNPYQAVLGHNNAAYHALLAGDLAAAREHVTTGLALAEARALRLPLQYLYSTRGELALAGQQWDEAEDWFKRGIVEAERNGNLLQVANYTANLSLAARGRGDLDGALMLLETAREQAEKLAAPYLQEQIDLWLAELFLERGERAAAAEALTRAEARLEGRQYGRLEAWAARLRQDLSRRGSVG
jgi:tetratricopeptide (TPR) repeat protein